MSGVARRLCFAGRHLDLDFMMRYVSKRRRAAQNFTRNVLSRVQDLEVDLIVTGRPAGNGRYSLTTLTKKFGEVAKVSIEAVNRKHR